MRPRSRSRLRLSSRSAWSSSDEIHFPDGRVLRDVPGGSGFYSTLGARLAVPRQSEADSITCLIMAGRDFPSSVVRQIQDCGVKVRLQENQEKLSTRGLLCYKDDVFGAKTFRYTSPPLRPDVHSLPEDLQRSSVVHTLETPEDLEQQAKDLGNVRVDLEGPRPLIAWEPSPLGCSGTLNALLTAASRVDIVSPNDAEVLAVHGSESAGNPYNRAAVEIAAAALAGDEVSPPGDSDSGQPRPSDRVRVTVVRCGEHGCLTVPRRGGPVWLPAFHGFGSERVVDATGAGNAFLGAFAVAFRKTGDEVLASAYGAVAASFVVEQVGPPRGEVVGGRELWNGEEFEVRLEEYRAKAATWDADVSCGGWPERKVLFG